MSSSRIAILGTFVLLSGWAAAQNPSSPITLREAVARARSHNPALLAARRNLESTRAAEITAGLR